MNAKKLTLASAPHPRHPAPSPEQGIQSQGQAAVFDVEVVIEAVFGAFAAHA